jgi:hypothetical protein
MTKNLLTLEENNILVVEVSPMMVYTATASANCMDTLQILDLRVN